MNYKNITTTTHTEHGNLKRRLDLRNLTDADARYLLLEGSRHIAITDQGKKKLFKAAELVPLVAGAPTLAEAIRYAQLSDTATVKKALEKKAKEFADE